MSIPGITVQPLIELGNVHRFNSVFFDKVRVPKENLVGEKNRGWHYIITTLDFERLGVSSACIGDYGRLLDDLVGYCNTVHTYKQAPERNFIIRHKLADLAIQIEMARLLCYRAAWMRSKGLVLNNESANSRLFAAELTQRVTRTAMEVLGIYGQLEMDSKWVHLTGRVERAYLTAVNNTIAAGTSEILRNVIATRGLGLPR